MGFNGLEFIQLVENNAQWRANTNVAINLRVP